MFRFKFINIFVVALLASACAHGQNQNEVLDLKAKNKIALDQFVDQIPLGTILIIGESHAIKGQNNLDQKNQHLLIQKLVQEHRNVSVGMEFIHWTQQPFLDQYLKKQTSEDQFLKDINWAGNPYPDYKFQILEPLNGKGGTFGINAPKDLTSFVGKNGISNLPQNLKSFLPPKFNLGNSLYKKRFFELMGDLSSHGGNSDFYFEAQSIWDDTMAWKSLEIMKSNPYGILVIIVGKFHAQYGGGLPSRIKARGFSQVITVTQSSEEDQSDLQDSNGYFYSKEYGLLSEFYW